MVDHSGHIIELFLIIIPTVLYLFRARLSFVAVFSLLLVGLIINGIFLHSDHQFISQLTEQTHQCCVLPVGVAVVQVFLFEQRPVYVDHEELAVSSSSITTYYSFYTRPPPIFS